MSTQIYGEDFPFVEGGSKTRKAHTKTTMELLLGPVLLSISH